MPIFVYSIALFAPHSSFMLMRAWANCGIKVMGAWLVDSQRHQRHKEQGRDYWTLVVQSQGNTQRQLGGHSLEVNGSCGWLLPPWTSFKLAWSAADRPQIVLLGFSLLIPPAWDHPLVGLSQPEQVIQLPASIETSIEQLLAAPDELAKRPWADQLLQYVIRGLAQQRQQQQGQAIPGPAWLQDAAASMVDQYRHHSFSLEDLALRYGLSPCHVSRQFKRHLGCGPVAWLRRERVRMGSRLLSSAAVATVEEAARRVGYSDPRQFWRHCVQETGHPPRHFLRPEC